EAEDKSKPPEENLLRRRKRQRAYRAQGWFLRQQSDLLIAVWDPMKEGKPGGTEDTLRRALHSGLPVAWIDPRHPEKPRLLTDPAELDVVLNDRDPLGLRPESTPDGVKDFKTQLQERGIRQLLQVHNQIKHHAAGEKSGPVWRVVSGLADFLLGRS